MSGVRSRRMRSSEAAFLYYEKPEARMHTGGVAWIAGDLTVADLQKTVGSALLDLPDFGAVVRTHPFGLGHPSWHRDGDADLERHLHVHDGTTLEQPGDLLDEAARILSTRLDRSRPLWEAHLFRGLPSGHSALVLKIHRALHPEIGSTRILEALCGDRHRRNATERPLEKPHDPVLAGATAGLDAAARVLLRSLEARSALTSELTVTASQTLVSTLPDFALPLRRLPFNGPASGRQALASTAFSFAEVREIRKSIGGSIRDVLLTVIAGALAEYLRERGESLAKRTLRVAVPLRVRPGKGQGSDLSTPSLLPVNVPLDIADPARRLRAIHGRTRLMAAANVPEWIAQATYVGGLVPAALQAAMGRLASPSFPLFNLTLGFASGPQIPLVLAGRNVTAYVPLAPVGYGQGLGCAVYNYNQRLHVGLTADREACPELPRIRDLLDEAFAQLKQSAGTGDIPPIETGAGVAAFG